MAESNDPKLLMSNGGRSLSAVAGHWVEGTDADGSTGIEWDVPAGAVSAEVYSDADAYCGAVAEADLDITGAGFNAWPIKADVPSLQFIVKGASKFSVKARTGNLGIVAIRWGGEE